MRFYIHPPVNDSKFYTIVSAGADTHVEVRLRVDFSISNHDEHGHTFSIWHVDYSTHDPVELLNAEQFADVCCKEVEIVAEHPDYQPRMDYSRYDNYFESWKEGLELIEKFKAMRTLGLGLAVR